MERRTLGVATLLATALLAVWVLASMLIATGCSQGSNYLDTPTRPSALGSEAGGSAERVFAQIDRRLPDFVPTPGISCPSVAPLVNWASGGVSPLVHLDGEWDYSPLAHQVHITVRKRNEADVLAPFTSPDGKTNAQGVMREEIRKKDGRQGVEIRAVDPGVYEIQTRYEWIACVGGMSPPAVRSVSIGNIHPQPPPEPESCEVEYGEGTNAPCED